MLKKIKNLRQLNLVGLLRLQGKERQMIYAVAIAIFLVINLLVSGLSLRYDASFGQAYTLSDSSRKIVRNIDDIVNIKFFASSDLPARLIPLKTDVIDILSEYKKEGKNKIQLKILDPKKDENAAREARSSGIPELQFSQLEQDKYAVTTAYFGMVISYGGREEVIPQVTDFENLEYNLTAAIYKLVKRDLPRVGIVGQTGASNPNEDNIASLKKILGQQFSIENLDFSSQSEAKKIDSAVKTLLVFDTNSKKYDEQEIKLLKDYLDKNGKAIFFVDGVWVADELTTSNADHNLFSLLEEFGIKIEKNLVLSTSAELVNFGGEQISLLLPYPFWFKTSGFNPKASYFSNISQLTYPWGSSLSLVKKAGTQVEELVKTSKRSWQQKDSPPAGGFVLNPQTIPEPEQKDLKEFIVAAEASKKAGGQIVAIPSSRFVQERFLGAGSGNLEFVLNIVSNLASGGALAGIRSRVVSFYPLPDLPEDQKDMFKYLNILLLPVLFSLWGGFRLMKRR